MKFSYPSRLWAQLHLHIDVIIEGGARPRLMVYARELSTSRSRIREALEDAGYEYKGSTFGWDYSRGTREEISVQLSHEEAEVISLILEGVLSGIRFPQLHEALELMSKGIIASLSDETARDWNPS